MLTKIRKGTDNPIVKTILIIIAFSFVAGGAAAFLRGNSGGDVVQFSKAESISVEDFLKVRARHIDSFQKQNGVSLSEEDINQLGINNAVLRYLVQKSMVRYLADYYDFDVSDDLVTKFIKASPMFQNEKGEFDMNRYKAVFHSAKVKEEEYIESVRDNMISAALVDIFVDSFTPPKLMVENWISYIAESRNVDIVTLDISKAPKGFVMPKLDDKVLEEFYNKNEMLFVVPETRSFEYIKFSRDNLLKMVKISEGELKDFFEENKEEFGLKSFSEAKERVKTALRREKLDEVASELAKTLEEDVSSGQTLSEIAKKYNLTIKTASNLSQNMIAASNNRDYLEMSGMIFEIGEGEVSYPIENTEKNDILLVSVKSITPSRQRPFAEAKRDAKTIVEKNIIAQAALQSIQETALKYNPKSINIDELENAGFKVTQNKKLIRADMPMEASLPPGLLNAVFLAQKDTKTRVVNAGNKAYFAYVRDIKKDSATAKKIQNDKSFNIAATIKEELFQELIHNMTVKNNMVVNKIPNL